MLFRSLLHVASVAICQRDIKIGEFGTGVCLFGLKLVKRRLWIGLLVKTIKAQSFGADKPVPAKDHWNNDILP